MALRSRWLINKEEVVAENGIVVAKDPLAAEVGLEVLKQGGNAVDAAVATGFAISVVEPMMSSVAGVGFMLIHMAAEGKNVVVEYPPRAPKAACSDMYRVIDRPGTGIGIYDVEGMENEEGYRSIAVPGTVAGLCLAHKLFGKLPLQQLVEPAIALAGDGFEVNWFLALSMGNAMDVLQRVPGGAGVFLPDGRPPKYWPKPAEKLVQRDLAQVLRGVAKGGPDAFYRGDVAAAIEEDMRANGGLISMDDLASYQAVARDPARINYRGYEVLTADIHFGGTTLLQTLNILQNFQLSSLGHNSPEYLHLFLEASRHAFADRYHYLGDSDFADVPMKGILSTEYAREVAATIDRHRAHLEGARDTEPWVYYETRPLHDPWTHEGAPKPTAAYAPSVPRDGDCTTHFGVVDRDRNLVSCTQTAVGLFGSKVVTPGLGILWNNGMVWFNPKPGTANSVAPWKRPLTNMAPVLVLKDGKPYLSIGSPGGRRIINCDTQVFLNVTEFGMGIQDAVAQPRVDASTKDSLADSRIEASTLDALAAMGHNVVAAEESPAEVNFAIPLGILVDHGKGRVHGGVDAFRIAEARGY